MARADDRNRADPLEEKMTLFWHHVFATLGPRSEVHTPHTMVAHIQIAAPDDGLGSFPGTLLAGTSRADRR